MKINTSEIKSTLKECYADMKDDKVATNDYVVEDLLIALGYNKKRNKAVKRTYGEPVDWVIRVKNYSMSIKVYAVGTEVDGIEVENVLKYSKVNKVDVVLVTNGEHLTVYKLSSEGHGYTYVQTIDLDADIDESGDEILYAISNNGFSTEVIDNILKSKNLTFEETVAIFSSEQDSFKNWFKSIVTAKNSSWGNSTEAVELFADTVLSSLESQDSREAKYREAEQKYTEYIAELRAELEEKKDKIAELSNKYNETLGQLNHYSGYNKKYAIEMLDMLEKAEAKESRKYAAVINDDVIEVRKLHKFVGDILQKLYELEGFNAMSFLFDGNIFKITSMNCKNNDMIIRNQAYDILVDPSEEDEVLIKLKKIFRHFDDIVFDCRKIGNAAVRHNTDISDEDIEGTAAIITDDDNEIEEESSVETINAENVEEHTEQSDEQEDQINEQDKQTEEQSDETDEQSDDDYYDEEEDALTDDEVLDSLDEMLEEQSDDSFDIDDNAVEAIGSESETITEDDAELLEQLKGLSEDDENETQDNYEIETEGNADQGDIIEGFDTIEEENTEDTLIVSVLHEASNLFSEYENELEFYNIAYLSSNDVAFDINSQVNEVSYDELLVKCVEALIAIEVYSDKDSTAVIRIKQKRLDEISKFIKRYSPEYSDCPRVIGTNYIVCGINSAAELLYTLTQICQELNIDTSDKFIFMTVFTKSEFIISNYGCDYNTVQIRNTDETYKASEEENTTTALIKGDMLNYVTMAQNALDVHKDIIKRVLCVKTRFTSIITDGNNYSYVDVIAEILKEAVKQNRVESFTNIMGVVGTHNKLLSEDESEVGDNAHEIDICGQTLYCADLEEWQIVVTIIRLYTKLFRDGSIVIKAQVDMDAINFYGSEFDTDNALDALAINSFSHYIAGHLSNQ
jgi:hypothetical protein